MSLFCLTSLDSLVHEGRGGKVEPAAWLVIAKEIGNQKAKPGPKEYITVT